MKTKYVVPVMAIVFMWGTAGLGQAAGNSQEDAAAIKQESNTGNPAANPQIQSPDEGIAPSALNTLMGTVQNIDNVNRTVQLKDGTGNLATVKVDESTEITREGNSVQLSEVRTGDVLVVRTSNPTMM